MKGKTRSIYDSGDKKTKKVFDVFMQFNFRIPCSTPSALVRNLQVSPLTQILLFRELQMVLTLFKLLWQVQKL